MKKQCSKKNRKIYFEWKKDIPDEQFIKRKIEIYW